MIEDNIKNILQKSAFIWDEIKNKKPLVYHITNKVAITEEANLALAIGARPVMAYSPEESSDMTDIADSLLLNIGTPSIEELYTMKKALKKANEKGIPVLLDPVGYGATRFRNEVVLDLLNNGAFSVIKGNLGEIAALSGVENAVSGVDSTLKDANLIEEIILELANKYNTLTVATGEEDIISDGKEIFKIKGGSKLLSYITGSGCMVGTIIASTISIKINLEACISGLLAMKISSERAEIGSSGPASFKVKLFDELFNLKGDSILNNGVIKKWN
jgi:hydroxyethylthiazole kinase